jgi:dipeptidyl aminopeptidase/acylaminoacyl peptidase
LTNFSSFNKFYTLQVVPPSQARKIYQALKEKGVPVALVEYEGEQHGFRKVHAVLTTF